MKRSSVSVILAAVILAGCGSSSPTSPGGSAEYSQNITGSVAAFSETRHPLTIPVSGDMTLRLTWSSGSVDLDLYLAASSCVASLYPLESCGIVAQSIASSGASETIRQPVSAGQEFQIWVDNLNTTTAMNYTLSVSID